MGKNGAEVKAVTASGDQCDSHDDELSYLSASDKRVHFWAPKRTSSAADSGAWPSGIVQTLKDVHANQILKSIEQGIPRW